MKKKLYPLFILLVISSAFNPCSAGKPLLNLKSTSGSAVLLRMNLYRIYSNKSILQDGTLTQYGDNYSNKIDGYDARKMSIPGENISLFRHDTDLVVERRQTMQSTDTIFFKMWGMQQTNYRMEIVPSNLDTGFTAFLIDNYLHTSEALDLSDTTQITFSINNDAASRNQLRFKIIFSVFKKPTPFTYVSLGAINQNNQVLINWKTENEINLKNYLVERSANQVDYQPIATIDAGNSSFNTYQWTDKNPLTESGFYRVRSVEANGTGNYSDVVKVTNNYKVVAAISVYPNPVIGNTINLNLNNQQPGAYKVVVYNSFGAVVLAHQFNCSSTNAILKIPVDKTISKGVYYLEISKPSGKKQLMNIIF